MRAALKAAMDMAIRTGQVFLSTADKRGQPHMSIVQPVDFDPQGRLKMMAWLCQYTLQNLQENPKVTIVVWDPVQDKGYQMAGMLQDMRVVAQIDGYAPGLEEKKHIPQVEWKILVQIEKVCNFQKAPHIDVEVK